MHGLADNIQLMTGTAIILVNIFNVKIEVNEFALVQTQGQTCVR